MKIAVTDIGGTAIKSGVFENGNLTHTNEIPSEGKKGGAHIIRTVENIIAGYGKIDAIGISSAGQIDSENGIVRFANENLPDYEGMNLRKIFSEKFDVHVYVENDVNAAATGEAAFGAGKGRPDFLCLTYGTGVGGAIVQGGKVFHGANFSAGEVGQMITHAEAPYPHFYYERYASASALVRNVNAAFSEITNGRQVFANISNPAVKTIVDNWIGEVLCGLATLIHIFNPSLIVLGGGIMQAEYIVPALQARLADYVVDGMRNVTLSPAQLGNDAGLYGMGFIASQKS